MKRPSSSLSAFFKALSEETRLRLLHLLFHKKTLCVCDLMNTLGLSQPLISRHLAYLKKRGLIEDKRRKKWVFYSLSSSMDPLLFKMLTSFLSDLKTIHPFQRDLEEVTESVCL